jgi:hypothetical protein
MVTAPVVAVVSPNNFDFLEALNLKIRLYAK